MGGSKSSTTTKIPKEIRERGTKITNAAMDQYFDPAAKYETFGYDNYSGVGEDTTGQLNQHHDAAGSAINSAGGAFQQAGSGYQPYFNRADSAMTGAAGNAAGTINGPDFSTQNLQRFQNPYQDLVIDQGVRKINDEMTQGRLQNQSRAALAGAFGGSRHGVIDAEGQNNAMQNLNDFIGTQLNRGYESAVNQYNTDYGQQVTATNLNNQAAGQNFQQGTTTANFLQNLGKDTQGAQIAAGDAQLRGADAEMKLGNITTAQEEAQKQNAYNYGYKDKRDYPMDVYERLAAINAGQPVNRTSTTSQSGGWLGPALGAVGSIMGSDERIKENVTDRDTEQVLGAFASVRPVEYDYKADAREKHPDVTFSGRRRGFMAQDLEKAFGRPAGPTLSDGTKTVDIPNLLGDLVAAVHGLEKRTRPLKKKVS